jgi:hypothetical protein
MKTFKAIRNLLAVITIIGFASCEADVINPDKSAMPPKSDIRIPPYGSSGK